MLSPTLVRTTSFLLGLLITSASWGEPDRSALEVQFKDTVHPFLETYCYPCHAGERPKGEFDLSSDTTAAAVAKNYRRWEIVLERLEDQEMPPEKAEKQPTPEERKAVIRWIESLRKFESERRAGDPGPVRARRLSNAEYNYTIRDLTGVDIRPTREFPVDPANEAGFDNSGESLTMSSALVQKYLSAAREVVDHLVLKPHGFDFAPHPVVAETDRDWYCVKRIVDFYTRHQVDLADYFFAAWRHRFREELGNQKQGLSELAFSLALSARYLERVWVALEETREDVGVLATLQDKWRELPSPAADNPEGVEALVRRECVALSDFVTRLRRALTANVKKPSEGKISSGSPILVFWKNRQEVARRQTYTGKIHEDSRSFEFKMNRHPEKSFELRLALDDGGDGGKGDVVVWEAPHFALAGPEKAEEKEGSSHRRRWSLRELLETHAPAEFEKLRFGEHPRGEELDAESLALEVPFDLALNLPWEKLIEDRQDRWTFVTRARIDPRHFSGGAVEVDCDLVCDGVSPDRYDHPVVMRRGDPNIPKYEAAFERFCALFPDAFRVLERGRELATDDENKLKNRRYLSAGLHLLLAYFRDDGPLYEWILDDDARGEIDMLWKELDFLTLAPIRQYKGFIFYERTESQLMLSEEFDFARSEDRDVVSPEKIASLAAAFEAKAVDHGAEGPALEAIRDYFRRSTREISEIEKAHLAAQKSHIDALEKFTERAYRRPLVDKERHELHDFYRQLRGEGLEHEAAIADALVSVLMSPYFCYRVDLPKPGEGPGPLEDHALASRLSYFLWSSMPDAELLAHALRHDLAKPEVLLEQVERMSKDPRIRGLATEFGGNWLDFRRFQEHNAVDRERFPSFTDDLRNAMFEEPVRFFVDLVERDGSILEFLYGDHTFVNTVLAKHYEMPVGDSPVRAWERVDDADRYGRGGLLPMSVFLTKNAPGLRTSPVKRGYWVVRRLLGEMVPPPPPTVPELPEDESKTGELSQREILAKHRAHESCAGCHERFDSLGLVFEGYGPVGERRTKDLGNRPVDMRATFPGGVEGAGIDGLRGYLRKHREEDFIDNLCRKLFSYALGRSLLLSDEPTLTSIKRELVATDYRFSVLLHSIVTSPQFLTKRGREAREQ